MSWIGFEMCWCATFHAPDTLRRLSWDPPQPPDTAAVSLALSGYGARPWQVELTAGPLAEAMNAGEAEAQKPGDG